MMHLRPRTSKNTTALRASLVFALVAPLAAVGCFQQLDTSNADGPAVQSGNSEASNGLPDAFPPNTDLSQPCPPNSALCYELCGSPTCALQDNSLPTNLATPPIMTPDGGLLTSSCDDIETLSMNIRQQHCAVCHGPGTGTANVYDWVLDDHQLVTTTIGTSPLVIAGNPPASTLYQRVMGGLSMSETGMPPATVTTNRPTSEDVSILYTWIAYCVEGADAGALNAAYYGAYYGPDASGPPPAALGPNASDDAGVSPPPSTSTSSGGGTGSGSTGGSGSSSGGTTGTGSGSSSGGPTVGGSSSSGGGFIFGGGADAGPGPVDAGHRG